MCSLNLMGVGWIITENDLPICRWGLDNALIITSKRKIRSPWNFVYQKGKILLEQEIVSGTGISWAICKSAPRPRQITTPAPPPLSFYRPDALPATKPTASNHWRQLSLTANLVRKRYRNNKRFQCLLHIVNGKTAGLKKPRHRHQFTVLITYPVDVCSQGRPQADTLDACASKRNFWQHFCGLN